MVDLVRLVARLDADSSGFTAAFNRAERDLNSFGARARRTQGEARAAFSAIGGAWTSMAGTLATIGVTVGLGSLLAEARDYERQLNAIRAVTRASASDMRVLGAATRRAGLDFGIGANAAAAAAYELTKSGIAISDLGTGALDAAIVLAQATGGEYADAATIAARATSVFRLETEDMARVVQGAVGVINAGHFELEDYVLALQQGGAAARDAGLSLEDFNTLLALTQRALGSSGSDTGTAARTFLSRLVPQSREAQAAMRNLNLTFYDSEGRFVGLSETARRLQVAFAGLSDEQRNYNLVTMFGVDAQRQAIALMTDGAEGIANVRTELANAGTAAEMANARMAGFAGATMNLSSAFEDLGIAIGESGINELLTNLTNWAAGGVREMSRGVRLLRDDAGNVEAGINQLVRGADWSDPTIRAIDRLARERFPDASLNQARASLGRDEIARLLNEAPRDYVGGGDNYPWNFGRWETYGDTPFGQSLRREYIDSLGGTPYVTPGGGFFANHRRRGPLQRGERAANGSSTFDPMANMRGDQTPWDQRGWLDDVQAMLFDRQDAENEYQTWLADIEQNIPKWGAIHAQGIKVEVEGFETNADQLKRIAEDWAIDVESSIRSAWTSNDWRFESIGESIAGAIRGAIYDALLSESMQAFLRWAQTWVRSQIGAITGAGSTAPAAGAGGVVKNALAATVTAAASSLFSGFFAEGGFIPPGQWGVTGEEGPEPIYGGKTGVTVYPASEGGGQSGVTNVFHIDARGADAGVEDRIRIAVEQAAQMGAQRGAAAVFKKINQSTTK